MVYTREGSGFSSGTDFTGITNWGARGFPLKRFLIALYPTWLKGQIARQIAQP